MNRVRQMFEIHPSQHKVNLNTLARCVDSCFECAQVCAICADACLSEKRVPELLRCIRLNLDCASICKTTGRIVACLTEPDRAVLTQQLQACITVCHVCGDECARHSAQHQHCHICSEACRQCETACRDLMKVI